MKSITDIKQPGKGDKIVSFGFDSSTYVETEDHLILENLTPDEARELLNRCTAKFARWSTLKDRVQARLRHEETSLEYKLTCWYNQVRREVPKASENNVKAQAIVDNNTEYHSLKKKINKLKSLRDKAETLVKTYEMQSWNLRSILSSFKKEMENLE